MLWFSLVTSAGLSKDPGLAILLPWGLGVRAFANFCRRRWLKSGANPGSHCPLRHAAVGVPPGDLKAVSRNNFTVCMYSLYSLTTWAMSLDEIQQ